MTQGSHPTSRGGRSMLLTWGLGNPLLSGLICLAILAATVALVTRDIFTGTDLMTSADVGTPARYDYKSARDFTYTELDIESTEKKREEVALSVLSVFDLDLEQRDQVVDQIRQSFQYMQGLFTDYETQLDAILAPHRKPRGESEGTGGSRVPGARAEGPRSLSDLRQLPPEVVARKKELDGWRAAQLEERKASFFELFHQALTQDEYNLLVAHEFNKEIADNLIYLVSGVMQNKVLLDTHFLKQQQEKGIRLRITRGGTVVDEIDIKDDFSEFISVQDSVEKLVLMARKSLKGVDPDLRDRLVDISGRLIIPNCQYNKLETETRRQKARASVENLSIARSFRKGQIIVDSGHIITPQHLAIYKKSQVDSRDEDLFMTVMGNSLIIMGLSIILFMYFKKNIRKFNPTRKDLVFIGLWLVAMLGLFRGFLGVTAIVAASWVFLPADAYIYLLPVAAVPMLVRMVLNSETAVLVTILEALLVAILVNWNLPFLIFTLGSGLVAAGWVGRAKQRLDLILASLRLGVINILLLVGLSAISGNLLSVTGALQFLLAGIGGIFSGLVVTALLPIIEATFAYTTNIKLLELANLNNPLLKELAIRAPGTFHHSILVGNLVEAAAEAIHSNSLLARVGAYYHDVGKLKAPQYFAENQRSGQNPHDRLKPTMSALILKDHVRDGVKMLRSKRYPQILADICEQHVGTTLIQYFYTKARALAEEHQEPPPLESDFRYPGPKPQTREAALVFLGDSVEAAAKSLSDPTPLRLQALVEKIVNERFIDDQLGECNLTLGDLHQIARAFTHGLTGLYHWRPEYPGDNRPNRKKEETANQKRTSPPSSPPRRTVLPASGPDPANAANGARNGHPESLPVHDVSDALPASPAEALPATRYPDHDGLPQPPHPSSPEQQGSPDAAQAHVVAATPTADGGDPDPAGRPAAAPVTPRPRADCGHDGLGAAPEPASEATDLRHPDRAATR